MPVTRRAALVAEIRRAALGPAAVEGQHESTTRESGPWPESPLMRAHWGPPVAYREAALASCAPVFGSSAAPKKPRTKGHSYP
eukprot:234413-Pyramimonas_sp.AAC.1